MSKSRTRLSDFHFTGFHEDSLIHMRVFVAPWTSQAPLSMELSRRGILEPFPSPGDLPDPGIKPGSPALQAGSLPSELQGSPSIKIYANTTTPYHFYYHHPGPRLSP